jgi:hypothetical protein
MLRVPLLYHTIFSMLSGDVPCLFRIDMRYSAYRATPGV